MHANAALLHKLFTALGRRDHETMASCYHPRAQFRDIAFDRDGRQEIRDMWRMICQGESEIEVLSFEIVEADDRAGRARVVDSYMYGKSKSPPKPGRRVVNPIESRFQFEDGLIVRQDDDCDEKAWAGQALGRGPIGFLAGRLRPLRSLTANAKLKKFLRKNPQ